MSLAQQGWAMSIIMISCQSFRQIEADLILDSCSVIAVKEPCCTFLLSHVRRWKHDKIFFAAARKVFEVSDVTSEIDGQVRSDEKQASHTRGALRLYKLTTIPLIG